MIFLISLVINFNDQTNFYVSERVLMEQRGSVFLKSRAEANNYLNNIFRDEWFRNNFKIKKPILIESSRPDWAYSVIGGSVGKIAVPNTGIWNWCILHEVAHHIVPNDNHGKDFAKVELLLIEHFINVEAANALRKSFRKNKIKF